MSSSHSEVSGSDSAGNKPDPPKQNPPPAQPKSQEVITIVDEPEQDGVECLLIVQVVRPPVARRGRKRKTH